MSSDYFEPITEEQAKVVKLRDGGRNIYASILKEFLNSDFKAVRVKLENLDRSPKGAQGCFEKLRKRYQFPIIIRIWKNQLYLMKVDEQCLQQ